MNKDNFNKLDVLEQIKYINRSIKDGYTISGICKEIGIGRSTISDRFKKNGFERNPANNQYESIIEVVDNSRSELYTKFNDESITKNSVIEENLKSSNKVVKSELNSLINKTDILNNIISTYNDNVNKLDEIYSWYKLQESSNKVVEHKKFKVDDFEGNIVVRSYKLYESIQKEFADFCKANNKYKVQDILCQFIKDGLEKYK